MSTIVQPCTPSPAVAAPVGRGVDPVKVYGEGNAAVRALDGITVGFGRGQPSATLIAAISDE